MKSNIYFDNLPTHAIGDDSKPLPSLFAFVDAQDLACPMPLLKTKLALKGLGTNSGTLYIISTDPNATNDLTAFCQKNGLSFDTWQSDNGRAVFHFLISKT